MKFNFKLPRKFIFGICGLAMAGILQSNVVFAEEVSIEDIKLNNSSSYEEWLNYSDEEKENTKLPNNNTAIVPQDIVAEYSELYEIPSITKALEFHDGYSLESVSASYKDSKYDLNSDAKVRVKHQGATNECWAFSTITSLETNISLIEHSMNIDEFSVKHMDYMTSRTFADGINYKGFGREVGQGGTALSGYNYLVNGTGAVLEKDMPFDNLEEKINLSEIDKEINRIATGYEVLPIIKKKYDAEGNVTYYDAADKQISQELVNTYRRMIKEHIIKYGAISTVQRANDFEYYNNSQEPAKAVAYYCDKNGAVQDHEITIVGWDDNYSKENFNSVHRPKHDGAYLVLNTYGTESFEKGYLHVSYDDVLVESQLYGVISNTKPDYQNLYQNDFYGGYLEIGTDKIDTGYVANILKRETSEPEDLQYVGITSSKYTNYEIYVNPTGTSLKSGDLIKIGTATGVNPGYIRVKVDKTRITAKEFAIVVKQTQTEGFYVPIEANISNSIYKYVSSSGDTSYISFDGDDWTNVTTMNIVGVDMKLADTCLKAFTVKASEEPKQEEPDEDPNQEDPNQEEPKEPEKNPEDDKPKNDTNEQEVEVPEDNQEENKEDNKEDNQEENKEDNKEDNKEENKEDNEEDNKEENKEDNKEDNKEENKEDNKEDNKEENKEENKETKIESNVYKITEDKCITNIPANTSYTEFGKNIKTNANKTKYINKDGQEFTDSNMIIQTGVKIMLDGQEYTLIVRGDTDGNGKITLTDLSKLIAHYNEIKTAQLSGAYYKAGDMNLDGKITLTDLSQLMVIYSSL